MPNKRTPKFLLTVLAVLLAYHLGRHMHHRQQYSVIEQTQQAIEWLVLQQRADGVWSDSSRINAVCFYALLHAPEPIPQEILHRAGRALSADHDPSDHSLLFHALNEWEKRYPERSNWVSVSLARPGKNLLHDMAEGIELDRNATSWREQRAPILHGQKKSGNWSGQSGRTDLEETALRILMIAPLA